MTEIDALKYELEKSENAFDTLYKKYVELLKQQGRLEKENNELKAKVDDKEIAVEVETEKLMQKVFNAIDEKIDELEKRYKFGQEVAKCCPMHNIRHSINTLKELKKELKE